MTSSQKQITMKRWILYTTYGWFIGILLVFGLAILCEIIFKMQEDSGGQAVVGIGMGTGVGLMQWLAIRKYLLNSRNFFWFTFIGFSSAFIFMDIVGVIIDSIDNHIKIQAETVIPITVLLSAFISGWLQYNFVFKKIMNKANKWIVYSMIGWFLATIITMSISVLNLKLGEYFPKVLIVIIALLFLSIGGPILGYITGLFIVPKINTLNIQTNNTNVK